jgi:F5/8 type C domain
LIAKCVLILSIGNSLRVMIFTFGILMTIYYLQASAYSNNNRYDGDVVPYTTDEGSLPPEGDTTDEGSLPPEGDTTDEGSLPPEGDTTDEGSLPPEGNVACTELNIRDITASGFETDPSDYHPPLDAIDKDSSTWWSNKDENSWVQIDLGEMNTICGLSVEWNKGDERKYIFSIEGSNNGIDFDEVFDGFNNFGTSSPEFYPIEKIQAQYIRLAITGTSSEQGWVSVKEVKVTGRPNP